MEEAQSKFEQFYTELEELSLLKDQSKQEWLETLEGILDIMSSRVEMVRQEAQEEDNEDF